MQNPCQKHTIDRPPIVYRPHDFKKPATPKTFLIIGQFLTIFFLSFFAVENENQFQRELSDCENQNQNAELIENDNENQNLIDNENHYHFVPLQNPCQYHFT